ncbi:MAG: hypothetical protein BGN94_20415 [Rhizobiales bacterium 68-8]|nr:MAG: hypothetical protein BGN94_20415 [Rhizobiales bacterium 68-8]
MSDGRTMPAIVRMRSSALTRTSCEPAITRLPLGSTSVTTAATSRSMLSDRSVAPDPVVEVDELILPERSSEPPAEPLETLPPRPRLRAASRLRSLWFLNCARSLIEIRTVRMSPTESARGSVNSRLCRSLHSEKRRGCGVAYPLLATIAGSTPVPTGDMVGATPTSLRLPPQPPSRPAAARIRVRRISSCPPA